ncbi:phosphatidylglycerol lysyltransferase domain-containing protein, partial [Rhizobium leguminosarum]|uniref:phosphatidylglycerol lysyltransferase domain-containing protein n=1 Tax=Rhizobium leguminosarum TaxID=384 RepID=UPI003F9E2929
DTSCGSTTANSSPSRWARLAVWRFVEAARAAGCRAVFSQISPALLSHCADAGLRAFQLGELAVADLRTFEMEGGKWAN